jgi:dihydroneopterin aldolase
MTTTAPRGGDSVFIESLVVDCVVGILPAERTAPQPLQVDAELFLDFGGQGSAGAAAGDIEKTVDYAVAAGKIRQLLVEGRFELLETAAVRLCDELLKLGAAAAVRAVVVTLRKPRALGGSALAGVRCRRERR